MIPISVDLLPKALTQGGLQGTASAAAVLPTSTSSSASTTPLARTAAQPAHAMNLTMGPGAPPAAAAPVTRNSAAQVTARKESNVTGEDGTGIHSDPRGSAAADAPAVSDPYGSAEPGGPVHKVHKSEKSRYFSQGARLMVAAGVKSEPAARAFLGRLLKDYGDDVVLHALATTLRIEPPDPKGYIAGVCRKMAQAKDEARTKATAEADARAAASAAADRQIREARSRHAEWDRTQAAMTLEDHAQRRAMVAQLKLRIASRHGGSP